MIELTLSQLLREKTKANPQHEFMVYADRDLRFTYAQFDKRVDDLACGLYAIGVRKGDNVGIWATNVPDWLQTFRIGLLICLPVPALVLLL